MPLDVNIAIKNVHRQKDTRERKEEEHEGRKK
jgi:hypothetical protein